MHKVFYRVPKSGIVKISSISMVVISSIGHPYFLYLLLGNNYFWCHTTKQFPLIKWRTDPVQLIWLAGVFSCIIAGIITQGTSERILL